MNMPLDYLNTLYKLAIDREKAERLRREEEEKRRQEEEKLKKQRVAVMARRGYVVMPNGHEDSTPSMSRPEAEAFEDMLEEGM